MSLFSLFNQDTLGVVRVVLDILFLSLIYFSIAIVVREMYVAKMVNIILVILTIYLVSNLLQLSMVTWLLDSVIVWIIIGTIVVFQPELRSVMSRIRVGNVFSRKRTRSNHIDLVSFKDALTNLRDAKRGAIIVFVRSMALEDVVVNRVELDAVISADLVETIFLFNTPIHDGAIIIQNNRISLAGCFLPMESIISSQVTQQEYSDPFITLGSRHRAALGLVQKTDAVVLVLSEERGSISLAFDGELYYNIALESALQRLSLLLNNNYLTKYNLREVMDNKTPLKNGAKGSTNYFSPEVAKSIRKTRSDTP